MALDSAVQSSKYFRAYAERGWIERQWIRLSHWTVGLYFRFCCRLRIEGEEHIPAQGGVLLASNHISMLDALLIPYAVMPLKGMQVVWSPAKEELFRIPVLRQILLSWGSFPVRRGRNDLRVMRRIVSLLSTGKMMLFPEGRRSRDGDLQAGNRMVGRFIYRAQPVVVPTVVSGTNHTFPQGAWLPRFGVPMMVRFGPPVDLKRYYDKPDSKQTSEAIIQDVMQAIAALQKMSASHAAPDSNQNS
jgi:1-acyl-sn-glycerol-3-phosphate acyltransferase